MAFIASEIMHRVSVILQDAGSVRWPPPELRLWLNDGMREIALHKPSAVAKTVDIALDQGTKQTLADGQISLMRVVKNVAGRAVTPIVREILDQQIPGWQDSTVLPESTTVNHVIQDMADPRTFYVVPGNDGTGSIEAVVAVMPTMVSEPASDVLNIESYTDQLDIPPIYQNALIDYMLYRAFGKDMNLVGAAQRAGAHYQQFANAIGLKVRTDQQWNIHTGQDQPNS